jgi:potassium-transporting ATPase KdpC subunit
MDRYDSFKNLFFGFMKKLIRMFASSLFALLAFTLIFGFAYPFLVFLSGKILFPEKANGSLLFHKGKLIGSKLIGQNFSQDRYFHPRPSASKDREYDASHSGASNLALTSAEWKQTIEERAKKYRALNKLSSEISLPIDALTSSASGLDPHISLQNARLQIPRIALSRHLSEKRIEDVVYQQIQEPFLGLFGQQRVNVLLLNLALDELVEEK